MEMTFSELIANFTKYVEDYGYESDEIRPLNNWIRDFLSYLELEVKETERC